MLCWHQLSMETELWLWAAGPHWGLQHSLDTSRLDQALGQTLQFGGEHG